MDKKETALYISDLILELRNLAKTVGLTTLQGLLEISYYEAYGAATSVPVPDGEDQRLIDMGHDARRALGMIEQRAAG